MVIAKSELNSSHVVSGGIIELLSDNQDNFAHEYLIDNQEISKAANVRSGKVV